MRARGLAKDQSADFYIRILRGGGVQNGDLIYMKSKLRDSEEEYIGLLISQERVGSKENTSVLYDVLLSDTNEILTLSDIYFEIWRIE